VHLGLADHEVRYRAGSKFRFTTQRTHSLRPLSADLCLAGNLLEQHSWKMLLTRMCLLSALTVLGSCQATYRYGVVDLVRDGVMEVRGTDASEVIEREHYYIEIRSLGGDDTLAALNEPFGRSRAVLLGGAGNDRYIFRPGSRRYNLVDGRGRDVLVIEGPLQSNSLKFCRNRNHLTIIVPPTLGDPGSWTRLVNIQLRWKTPDIDEIELGGERLLISLVGVPSCPVDYASPDYDDPS
jgi:hypothetical protein